MSPVVNFLIDRDKLLQMINKGMLFLLDMDLPTNYTGLSIRQKERPNWYNKS
jgi:hypothetical protein